MNKFFSWFRSNELRRKAPEGLTQLDDGRFIIPQKHEGRKIWVEVCQDGWGWDVRTKEIDGAFYSQVCNKGKWGWYKAEKKGKGNWSVGLDCPYKPAEPEKPAEPAKAADKQKGGIRLGGNLRYTRDQHLLTIAPIRTGKFTTAIAPAMLTYPGSCIVVDPKGEIAAVTARTRRDNLGHKVFFINPFKLHGLPDHGFNPLMLLDPDNDNFDDDALALAENIILASGGDSHWTDSARNLVHCLIMWVRLTEKKPSFSQVLAILNETDRAVFQDTMRDIRNHPFEPMAYLAAPFVNDDHRDSNGFISTARGQVAPLGNKLIAQSLAHHSFDDWLDLKDEKITVYLMLPAEKFSRYAVWVRVLLTSALSRLATSGRGEHPVLFLIDEFTTLGRMQAVLNAWNVIAGFGVQLWAVFQSLPALEDVYGKAADVFLSGAGVIQLFGANDPTTAKHFSDRAGKYTKKTMNFSSSTGESTGESSGGQGSTSAGSSSTENVSVSEIGVDLLSSQDLYGFPEDECLIFLGRLASPTRYKRKPYYLDARYDGLYDPNPIYGAPKRGHKKAAGGGALVPVAAGGKAPVPVVGFLVVWWRVRALPAPKPEQDAIEGEFWEG